MNAEPAAVVDLPGGRPAVHTTYVQYVATQCAPASHDADFIAVCAWYSFKQMNDGSAWLIACLRPPLAPSPRPRCCCPCMQLPSTAAECALPDASDVSTACADAGFAATDSCSPLNTGDATYPGYLAGAFYYKCSAGSGTRNAGLCRVATDADRESGLQQNLSLFEMMPQW